MFVGVTKNQSQGKLSVCSSKMKLIGYNLASRVKEQLNLLLGHFQLVRILDCDLRQKRACEQQECANTFHGAHILKAASRELMRIHAEIEV